MKPNLDGKTWLKYSVSIWSDVVKSADERKLGHPAIFPESLVERLFAIYPAKRVLDPFVGVGTTLVVAKKVGAKAVGFDVSKEYIKIAKSRLKNVDGEGKVIIINDDARELLDYYSLDSFDLCLTSPPYWDILNAKRSADLRDIRSYDASAKSSNLGEIRVYEEFLKELKGVFKCVYKILRGSGYCIVVVMDIRKKSKFYPFHCDVIELMSDIGFVLEDIIIWDRSKEYNNLKPLGYPYVFRVNKVHEYILVFKK